MNNLTSSERRSDCLLSLGKPFSPQLHEIHIYIYIFWGGFKPFIEDRIAKIDRKWGNDMQERTTGGGEAGSPAVRTAASIHGAPALPAELNDAPTTEILSINLS